MTIRILLWLIAFVVPALALGVPFPHTLYVLIPALVAVDGLSRHGGRRILLWIALSLLYEMVYQLPLGVFALTILVVGGVHMGLAYVIRIDTYVKAGRWRPVHLGRSLVVAFLWMSGMVVVSTMVSTLVASSSSLSWHAIGVTWLVRGAAFGGIGIMAIVLGALFWERTLRLDHIFSDDALVQTTDLSD